MGWSYTDLTAATTAPLIATVNFAAYPFNGGLTQHVIYIGIDFSHPRTFVEQRGLAS